MDRPHGTCGRPQPREALGGGTPAPRPTLSFPLCRVLRVTRTPDMPTPAAASFEGFGVTLKPFVVGSDGEGSLDELRRLGLVLEGVATQQRVCDKLSAGGHACQVQPFLCRKAVSKGLAQAASSMQQAGERRDTSASTRSRLTVAERVDVLSIHLQRRLVHLLGRLVLAMHRLQKRAIVAQGIDLCTRMCARASSEHAARSSCMPRESGSPSSTHAARDSQPPACS